MQRAVLDAVGPAGTAISIEREVFPALIGSGLYGYVASGYWLDIGTPERYLEATFDILDRKVSTAVGDRIGDQGSLIADDARVDGRVIPPAVVGSGCEIASGAIVERSVLGSGVTVGADARIDGSVVLDGASVGQQAIIGSSIVGPNATIGNRCRLADAVVGEGVELGSDSALEPGARIFPGVRLPEGASRS
jgi:mannose-1-phosphate guanylyltransferase